jgi:hypothetical protein
MPPIPLSPPPPTLSRLSPPLLLPPWNRPRHCHQTSLFNEASPASVPGRTTRPSPNPAIIHISPSGRR